MSAQSGAPVSPTGALPSLHTLSRVARYVPTRAKDLADGEVILWANSAHYVVKRPAKCFRGDYVILRELVTNTVRTVRIEARIVLSKLVLDGPVTANFEGSRGTWNIAPGDVVLYPGSTPERHVLAIRHARGWHRTTPPWTPFSDVEVAHDLVENLARMVHSNVRRGYGNPLEDFKVGSVVVSRGSAVRDPSVWFRQARDYWVGNCRQAPLSDQMIRYELSRGSYAALRLPEDA